MSAFPDIVSTMLHMSRHMHGGTVHVLDSSIVKMMPDRPRMVHSIGRVGGNKLNVIRASNDHEHVQISMPRVQVIVLYMCKPWQAAMK